MPASPNSASSSSVKPSVASPSSLMFAGGALPSNARSPRDAARVALRAAQLVVHPHDEGHRVVVPHHLVRGSSAASRDLVGPPQDRLDLIAEQARALRLGQLGEVARAVERDLPSRCCRPTR